MKENKLISNFILFYKNKNYIKNKNIQHQKKPVAYL